MLHLLGKTTMMHDCYLFFCFFKCHPGRPEEWNHWKYFQAFDVQCGSIFHVPPNVKGNTIILSSAQTVLSVGQIYLWRRGHIMQRDMKESSPCPPAHLLYPQSPWGTDTGWQFARASHKPQGPARDVFGKVNSSCFTAPHKSYCFLQLLPQQPPWWKVMWSWHSCPHPPKHLLAKFLEVEWNECNATMACVSCKVGRHSRVTEEPSPPGAGTMKAGQRGPRLQTSDWLHESWWSLGFV